ncbi:MAG: Uma2 family endonuclease [Pyrinomonadaceae bacterium]
MSRRPAKRWITADEYERMGEAGIFGDARLELIEGEIYEMSPIGSRHAACVTFLSMFLTRQFGDSLIVITQNPVRLNDFSEPQPDVALLRWRDDFYRRAHPSPADVLLLIEVSDTTVESDRTVKVPLYAAAGIPEVWLVNLPDERVEIYAGPAGGAYQSVRNVGRGEEAQALAVAGLSVNVADLLG